MNVQPFKLEHLQRLDPHEAQKAVRALLTPQHAQQMASGQAYSYVVGRRVLACAGILDLYEDPSIGHVWSLLSRDVRGHLTAIHRAAQRMIEVSGKRLLIATAETEHELGCKWMRLLRFKFDHIEPSYGPDGRDHAVYMRVI